MGQNDAEEGKNVENTLENVDQRPLVKEDRDQKGKFVKGWRGGPGLPRGTRLNVPPHRRLLKRQTVLDAFRNLHEAALAGKPWAVKLVLKIVQEERRRQGGKDAEPLGPRVVVNMDLSASLAGPLADVMNEPLVPGLPPL